MTIWPDDRAHGAETDALEEHVLQQDADVLIAGGAAERLAEQAGFPANDRAEIALAVRELAGNAIRHAGGGRIRLTTTGGTIEVVVTDEGPGIPDVPQAMADGYSTRGSLGYGIGTANRLMDELHIQSALGCGTTVRSVRHVRPTSDRRGPSPLDAGVATTPKPGFEVNGDSAVQIGWGHRLLLGVIDGVGHGEPAHTASTAARRYVESHRDQPLEAVFRGTGIACRGTRGVVMALARIDWEAWTLEMASVGNIEARLLHADASLGVVVRRGIIGVNAPQPRVSMQPWPRGATLVMHSDGVPTHWEGERFDTLVDASATLLAREILHRLNRGSDDATVAVVRDRTSRC